MLTGEKHAVYQAVFCGKVIRGSDAQAIYDAVLSVLAAQTAESQRNKEEALSPIIQKFERLGCPESAEKPSANA
jgi:hypothetical protein